MFISGVFFKDTPSGAPPPKKRRLVTSDEAQPSTSDCLKCSHCNLYIAPEMLLAHRRSNQHKAKTLLQSSYDGVFLLQTAFKNRIATFQIPTTRQTVDYVGFLNEIKQMVLRIIEDSIIKDKTLKLNFELFGNYYLKTTGEFSVKSFNTKNEVITVATNLVELYDSMQEILIAKAQEFNENKSGNL